MSKCKQILYLCDIIGLKPKIMIFNKEKYKSTFSAILSIIVVFFALSFTVMQIPPLFIQKIMINQPVEVLY